MILSLKVKSYDARLTPASVNSLSVFYFVKGGTIIRYIHFVYPAMVSSCKINSIHFYYLAIYKLTYETARSR